MPIVCKGQYSESQRAFIEYCNRYDKTYDEINQQRDQKTNGRGKLSVLDHIRNDPEISEWYPQLNSINRNAFVNCLNNSGLKNYVPPNHLSRQLRQPNTSMHQQIEPRVHE